MEPRKGGKSDEGSKETLMKMETFCKHPKSFKLVVLHFGENFVEDETDKIKVEIESKLL